MDIVDVKNWTTLKAAFVVNVPELDILKEMAEAYGEPYILKHKKEYLLLRGASTGGIPICFRFKD